MTAIILSFLSNGKVTIHLKITPGNRKQPNCPDLIKAWNKRISEVKTEAALKKKRMKEATSSSEDEVELQTS